MISHRYPLLAGLIEPLWKAKILGVFMFLFDTVVPS
jgi:hypothetical protein